MDFGNNNQMHTTLTEHFPQKKQTHIFPWLFLVLGIVLIYNLITFNRYLPLSEGWFSTYAQLILAGKMPYRDFYFFFPPLYPLTLAGIIAIFGPSLIVLRIFGIGIILLMSGTLYALLARFFRSAVAAIVTLVTMIYYQSTVTHITYDFTQFVSAYALLSAYFFIKYYDHCTQSNLSLFPWGLKISYLLLSGIFGALTFWTKQSNGTVIVGFIGLGIILVTLPVQKRWMLKTVLGFISGFALVSVPMILWLAAEGVLVAFYQQVFIGAAQAKGSLSAILFAWIGILFSKQYFIHLLYVSVGLLLLGYWHLRNHEQHPNLDEPWKKEWIYIIVLLCLGCAITIPLYLPLLTGLIHPFAERTIPYLVVVSSATILFALMHYYFNPEKRSVAIFLSIFALGLMYGCGTSPSIAENGAFMGLALFLCYVLSTKSFFEFGKIVFLTLIFIWISFFAQNKYTHPYAWWYLETPPISQAKIPADATMLRGLYLPTQTQDLLHKVDSIVQKNSTPDDEILSFPNIPLFYLLENRLKNIHAIVHWPDFLPDDLARREARRIQAHPPKIIIYLDLPEIVWASHEKLFRSSHQSGQRQIIRTIKEFTHEYYSLKAKIPVCEKINLYVWVKNQEQKLNAPL